MFGYTLALLAATTQAVHIHSHADAEQDHSPCYWTGQTWDAQIDGGETEPFYDITDREANLLWRGAWDGFYVFSDYYWDMLNDKTNDCKWPEFRVECTSETGHEIGDWVFELSRWGLLSIYPDLIDNNGESLVKARCVMDTFFEDFPLDKKSKKTKEMPPEGANYHTRGTFTMAIGF